MIYMMKSNHGHSKFVRLLCSLNLCCIQHSFLSLLCPFIVISVIYSLFVLDWFETALVLFLRHNYAQFDSICIHSLRQEGELHYLWFFSKFRSKFSYFTKYSLFSKNSSIFDSLKIICSLSFLLDSIHILTAF